MKNTYSREIEFSERFSTYSNLKVLHDELVLRFNVLGRDVTFHLTLKFHNGDGREYDTFDELKGDKRAVSDIRDKFVRLEMSLLDPNELFGGLSAFFLRTPHDCSVSLSASDDDGSFREEFVEMYAAIMRLRDRIDGGREKTGARTNTHSRTH